jgi:hypothetical protein
MPLIAMSIRSSEEQTAWASFERETTDNSVKNDKAANK